MPKSKYLHFTHYPPKPVELHTKCCGISIDNIQKFVEEQLQIEIIIVAIDFSTEDWVSARENCVLHDSTKLKKHISEKGVINLKDDDIGVFYSGDRLRKEYNDVPIILIRKDAHSENLYHELFHAHNFIEHNITDTEHIRNHLNKKVDHLRLAVIHLADELYAWEKTFNFDITFQSETHFDYQPYLKKKVRNFEKNLADLDRYSSARYYGAAFDKMFYNFTKPLALLKIKNPTYEIELPEVLKEFKTEYFNSKTISDLIPQLEKWVKTHWIKPISEEEKIFNEIMKNWKENS